MATTATEYERRRRQTPERKEYERQRSQRRRAAIDAWAKANPDRIKESARRSYLKRTAPQRAERKRRRSLKAMLNTIEGLAAKVEAPCDCEACRGTRARLDRRERRLQRMAQHKVLIQTLKGTECCECGIEHEPQDLHFHHRDPGDKLFKLSVARGGGYVEGQIRAEAAKCDVLCAPCHRKRHGAGV